MEKLQKLVSIDDKKKDISKIKEDLAQGWVIANMLPHGNGFLCVLEKTKPADRLLTSSKTGSKKDLVDTL
jgi:hypothetical protein